MQVDKLGHALAGAVISLVTLLAFSGFGLATGWPLVLVILGGAALAGLAKEILDRVTGRGHVDVWDVIATVSGGFLIAIATAQLEGGLF